MKRLVLAEKPSVARDLSKILGADQKHKNYYEGKDHVVTWALGHLLTLKMPEDLKNEWQTWQMETLPMIPKYIGTKPLPKTKAQLKAIANLAKRKDISEAIIATDAGREGELVARWILEYIRFNKPVKRLWISSQTNKAIKEGFAALKPAKAYDDLYYSALARAKADWLIGLNVTRALTVKYQDNLSAGRVQTPTLALVAKQEEKISKFIPQKYFTLSLEVAGQRATRVQKDPYALKERHAVDELVKKLSSQNGKVEQITAKDKTIPAPLPYDLTELQRVANEKYGYSAKKTLSLVQSLYEVHKIVSYPRTDSKYLSNDLKVTLKDRLHAIAGLFPEAKQYAVKGAKVVQNKAFNDAKVTDHHALIPTEQLPQYNKLNSDEHRIYTLIAERFVGLFAAPHKERQEKIVFVFGKEHFKLIQTKVIEAGWKKKETPEKSVAKFSEGMQISPRFTVKEALTTPPKPLSEGALLAQMERYSLGTPATRAEIIEKLVKSELMERTNNSLRVTKKGQQLLELVNEELVSPQLTEKWERQLEQIAKGNYDSKKFLREIETDTKRLVREVKNSQQKYQDFSLTKKKCPKCGAFLKEKKVRDGKLLVCTSESCDYKRRAEAKVSNHRCPVCHKKMLIVSGKNGDYFRCKYDGTTEKLTGGKKKNKKMTKHEERRLLKKINQDDEPQESALAQALKAALGDNNV